MPGSSGDDLLRLFPLLTLCTSWQTGRQRYFSFDSGTPLRSADWMAGSSFSKRVYVILHAEHSYDGLAGASWSSLM